MNENRMMCKNIVDELTAIYNGEILNDDGEQITLYDYFCDVLDFEYTISSRKEYVSVKIWVTLGGPSIWIDTGDSYVRLAWGHSQEEYPLSYNIRDEIDNIFEEYYSY